MVENSSSSSGSSRGFSSNVSKLLQHRGSASSPLSFRQALSSADVTVTDEKQLADIMVGVLPTGDDDTQKWNLDVVVEVLSQDCNITGGKKINWKSVVENLDNVHLHVRSLDEFQLLAKLFLRISGTIFPAAGLVGTWTNRTAQLYMLILAANSPKPELVDFSDMVSIETRIRDAPFPPNLSYLCLPLYDALLELAGRDLQVQVLKTLTAAAESFPEYVTILLAQAKDRGTSIRGEVLSRSLQKFTGLTGSRPTSLAVMQQLAKVNPDLLVWLLRSAFKWAATARDMSEVLGRLQTLGDAVARRVDQEVPAEDLVGMWCVKADRSDFSLDAKLTAELEKDRAFSKPLAVFARAHAPKLRPKRSDGGIVSYESFNIILKVLQQFTKGPDTAVSPEDLRELAMFAQKYQPDAGDSEATRMRSGGHMTASASDGEQQGGSKAGGNKALDEIERQANLRFQQIYTGEMPVEAAVQMLKQLKTSSEQRDQEIFRCMIHNLFDEYRFFNKYQDKELLLTAQLFGMLIQFQLVSSITLGIALRYVLEALRKDPAQGGAAEKMFTFGRVALEQFRTRLAEWPQYCSHTLQIPHFARQCPQLYQESQNALNIPSAVITGNNGNNGNSNNNAGSGASGKDTHKVHSTPPVSGLNLSKHMSSYSLLDPTAMPYNDFHKPVDSSVLPEVAALAPPVDAVTSKRDSMTPIIETMVAVNVDPVGVDLATPGDAVRDQIYFIINNIAQNNFEAKL